MEIALICYFEIILVILLYIRFLRHQPPLVLPRRGDAGYSNSVKDWEMQVTPNLISH